jgi:hypothetical protein
LSELKIPLDGFRKRDRIEPSTTQTGENEMNLNKTPYQSFVITKVIFENKKLVDMYL